jgi:predicted permease
MALIDVIIPVCMIFFVGYIGQKILSLDIKSISTAALYLMLPALMFITFYQTELNQTFLKIVIYVVLLSVIII